MKDHRRGSLGALLLVALALGCRSGNGVAYETSPSRAAGSPSTAAQRAGAPPATDPEDEDDLFERLKRIGAIFGPLDTRPIPAAMQDEAAYSVALMQRDTVDQRGDDWPMYGDTLVAKCRAKCKVSNPKFFERYVSTLHERFGEHRGGVTCGGALVSDEVVATPAHCLSNRFDNDVAQVRVLVDYQAGRDAEPEVHEVVRAYLRAGPEGDRERDLALLVLDGPVTRPPPPVGTIDDQAYAMGIGHPFGVSRVAMGANEHTRIARCADGRLHTTLDTFQHCSGSAVFFATEPGEDATWMLTGLLADSLTDDDGLVCTSPPKKKCKTGAARPRKTPPCESHVVVTPLAPAFAAAQNIATTGEPGAGWHRVAAPPGPPDPAAQPGPPRAQPGAIP